MKAAACIGRVVRRRVMCVGLLAVLALTSCKLTTEEDVMPIGEGFGTQSHGSLGSHSPNIISLVHKNGAEMDAGLDSDLLQVQLASGLGWNGFVRRRNRNSAGRLR